MDREYFDQLTGADASFQKSIAESFIMDFPKRLEELEALVRGGELEDVRKKLHYLKGSASNLGAKPMLTLLHKMRERAIAEDREALAEGCERLRTEFERIAEILREAYIKA